MDQLDDLLDYFDKPDMKLSLILSKFIDYCKLNDLQINNQLLNEFRGYHGIPREQIPDYRLISYATISVDFDTGYRKGRGHSILEVFPQPKMQEIISKSTYGAQYPISDLEDWMNNNGTKLDVSAVINLLIGKIMDYGGTVNHNFGSQRYYLRLTKQFIGTILTRVRILLKDEIIKIKKFSTGDTHLKPKNLKVEIDVGYFKELIKQDENRKLDFKQMLYNKNEKWDDTNKNDFLADITAMANSLGGHIIFGVIDKSKELVGISIPNYSEETMQNIISDRTEPPIRDLSFQIIDYNQKKFLVIIIPESINKPVEFRSMNGKWRTYIRAGSTNREARGQDHKNMILNNIEFMNIFQNSTKRKNMSSLEKSENKKMISIVDQKIDDRFRINDENTVIRPIEKYIEFEGVISVILKFYNSSNLIIPFILKQASLISDNVKFEFREVAGGRLEFPISTGYMNKRINFTIPSNINFTGKPKLNIEGQYFREGKKIDLKHTTYDLDYQDD